MGDKQTLTSSETDDSFLKIYTLGRFLVLKGDVRLSTEHGRSRKIWELFMYFISNRNRCISSESIVEALWVDQDYTSPSSAFKNLVYRLRRTIEGDKPSSEQSMILYNHGCYGWNCEGDYWLDVEAFEKYCHKGQYLVQENASLACDNFCRALKLYVGEYLPGSPYSDWIQPLRQYYRQLFVKSMSELISIYKKQHLYTRIIQVCEQILQIERFEEEIHFHYMEALCNEEKTAKALNHYEYVSSLLYRELGTKPNGAMKNLYRSIKKQIDREHTEHCDIQDIMKEHSDKGEAFYCNPEFFKSLCAMEKRRAERNKSNVYIGILTLDGHDYRLPSHVNIDESMNLLKESLADTLRKSDVFTLWNEGQYAILLPATAEEQALKILGRVSNSFEDINAHHNLVLRKSIHPILPFKHK